MVRISNNISLQDTVKISGLSTAPVDRHTAPSVPPPVDTLPAVGLRTSSCADGRRVDPASSGALPAAVSVGAVM